jgi:hypothetical protein
MRGYWKANPGGKPDSRGHFPDTFKLPNHPTFSAESKYATPGAPRWTGDKLIRPNGEMVIDESSGLEGLSGVAKARTPAMTQVNPLIAILGLLQKAGK